MDSAAKIDFDYNRWELCFTFTCALRLAGCVVTNACCFPSGGCVFYSSILGLWYVMIISYFLPLRNDFCIKRLHHALSWWSLSACEIAPCFLWYRYIQAFIHTWAQPLLLTLLEQRWVPELRVYYAFWTGPCGAFWWGGGAVRVNDKAK